MSRRARDFLVPPSKGPLASLKPGELRLLDAQSASADSMNEAEPTGRHASRAVLNAGQAAVDVINAGRQATRRT